jgi:hypothetical protein
MSARGGTLERRHEESPSPSGVFFLGDGKNRKIDSSHSNFKFPIRR